MSMNLGYEIIYLNGRVVGYGAYDTVPNSILLSPESLPANILRTKNYGSVFKSKSKYNV